jgi:hypothetical protein
MKLPGLKASDAGLRTTDVPVRFASDLQTELLPGRGLWWWRVRVQAEYLPLVTDFVALDGVWIIAGTPGASAGYWILGGTPGAPAPDFTNPGTPGAPATIL